MHDVIIVGGGVAGSRLAGILGKKHNVLLVERSNQTVPKDSGIVSTKFDEIFGKDAKRLIKSDIRRIDCVSPGGNSFSLENDEPYAHILRRKRFSKFLRQRARKACDVVYGNAHGVSCSRDRASVKVDGEEHAAKLVVGCDGANSVVRRSLKIASPQLALGIMVKTKRRMDGSISVYMNKYFSPDFFSWIIPESGEYGLMTSVRPASYLDYFAKAMYLPPGRTYAYMIPYTYTKSYSERALLVGDACGQNKPLTGGGIIFSLTAANHAAQTINNAIEANRFDELFLSFYEKRWKKELAWEIEKQFMVRKIYRKLTNAQIDKLFLDFGLSFSRLRGFDYDRLSRSLASFPKIKLIRFALGHIGSALI